MKLSSEDRPIERVNTSPERQFTIKATGKAFRILSSGLYKDKILAIVRELSCNAYDAHIAAGKPDLPFDIHLPTPLEPYFSVRDYGPALSPVQMDTVFTTYFESTKTDSNDQIGGLGLGCKSPLSYVDSFVVESIWEGTKRVYTVYFDETDTPSITMMTEEGTDEPTGILVKVNVKANDFATFHRKAADVFRFFPTEPNISGNPSFEINHPKALLSTPDYILAQGGGQSYAIMGTVVYPLSSSSMTGVQLNTTQSYLIDNGGCFIRFPVGDLDITAGREELSYIPLTTKRIIERVDVVLGDLAKRTAKKFRACKTEYEARKLYGQIVQGTIIGRLFPEAKVPFRDVTIDSSKFWFDYKKFDAVQLISLGLVSGDRIRQDIYSLRHAGAENGLHLDANDNMIFLIDDLGGNRTMMSRVRRLINEDEQQSDIYLIRAFDDTQFDAFLAMIEGVEVKKLSELPKSPPKSRAPVSVSVLHTWAARQGTADINRNSWQKTDVDPSEGGIYVHTKSCIIQCDDRKFDNFSYLYKKAKNIGLFDGAKETLYAIPKTIAEDFTEEDGWINYFDHVREAFIAAIIKNDWGNQLARANARVRFKAFYAKVVSDISIFRCLSSKLGPDHTLASFIALFDVCADTNVFQDHTEVAEILNVPMTATESFDLLSLWRQFVERYPMIEYVLKASKSDFTIEKVATEMADYINMIDFRDQQEVMVAIKQNSEVPA